MSACKTVRKLVKNPSFKKRMTELFNLQSAENARVSLLGNGMSKQVSRVKIGGQEFAVKEIVLSQDLNEPHDDSDPENLILSFQEALYEIHVCETIAAHPEEARYFPRHFGSFYYLHPKADEYTGKMKNGKFISAEEAKIIAEEEAVSFLIVEELIKGRKPTPEELIEAENIRAAGIKRCPEVWLTTDIDSDDIIVREDGSPVFIDVGNYKDFTPAQDVMLEILMRRQGIDFDYS